MRFATALAVGTSLLMAGPAALLAQGYGQAVVVEGQQVFVGQSLNSATPGYVYVYEKDGSAWAEVQRLEASDAADGDHFGRAFAAVDGQMIIGATVGNGGTGAAYVFERDASGTWQETGKLVASDASTEHSFGRASATDGETVLLADWGADGGKGAVYAFQKGDMGWTEVAKFSADDGEANDFFGMGLAVDGDLVAIGAGQTNGQRGAVYVFRRDAMGTWSQTHKLELEDAEENTSFGRSVVVHQGMIGVGAPGYDGFSGAVFGYGFDENSNEWEQHITLRAFDGGGRFAQFGAALNKGDEPGTVLISAPGAHGTGAIYTFTHDDHGNAAMALTTPEDANPGSSFAFSLSTSESLAAVGLPGADFNEGVVSIYEKDDAGRWMAAATVFTDSESTYEPILGAQVNCADGAVQAFGCEDVDVMSFLPVKDIGGARGVQLNDVWGWTDPDSGREYALVGRYDGTAFIDISNPTQPVYLGELPMTEGARGNAWRDIKVYENHAYIVADGAGPHGMQVFDLTRLRDVPGAPVTFDADAHYANIASAHNIVINEATGFAYAVGVNSGGETCGGGLHMIDVRDQKNPTFVGCFQDTETGRNKTGYSHDAQCVTYHGPDTEHEGKEICLGSNETALSIADVSDKDNPIALANAAYPNVAYTHQGWLDEQHEYFYMNDEGDESSGQVSNTRTMVWDVKDLDDPVLVKEYFGPSRSIDHNLYVRGDLMYQSNYVSGLRIIDISDRENPREIGFFDTVPTSDEPVFDGSWSNYPFFASGVIVVTSGREGVFFLKKREVPVS